MKKISQYLLLSSLPVFMTSCFFTAYCPHPRTDLLRLSAETRRWFVNTAGQTLAFRDEAGRADTLRIVQYDDVIEKYWQGDECPERPQEVITIKLVGNPATDTIFVVGDYENQLRITTATINLVFLTDTHVTSLANKLTTDTYVDSLSLRGKRFSSVLKVVCTTCQANEITELYMARDLGLIAYSKGGKLWVYQ